MAMKPGAHDIDTLKVLIRRTHDEEWAFALSGAESRLSADEVKTLLGLFKKLDLKVDEASSLTLRPAPTQVHCVRCHDWYIDNENATDACVIQHSVCPSKLEGQLVQPGVRVYSCESCRMVGYDGGAGKGIVWQYATCYEGYHTTNWEEVDKYDGDNTLTCKCSERDTGGLVRQGAMLNII